MAKRKAGNAGCRKKDTIRLDRDEDDGMEPVLSWLRTIPHPAIWTVDLPGHRLPIVGGE
jgi:hypothetical protein